MISCRGFLLCLLLASSPWLCGAPKINGDRLTYLDQDDPFYVHGAFPKLTTPQWIGETGVEAVVILAIDDLRSPEKYETVLRPILTRLKQIDGRAPVSIFCNALNPELPQFQTWLAEGLSLENHTLSHPCPLLAQGNFAGAAQTYQGGIELLSRIPGNKPVAFRMPCCDSMNSPSPRFYAEMFSQLQTNGQFLQIDSSVMNLISSKDTTLPRHLVLDSDGQERFWKYLPRVTNATTRVSMGSFTTVIENYPYPYVIGRRCWEFPAMAPSDWEAQNLHGVNNPKTVADWKAALDVTVLKQGVFSYIFHPHGWIKPEQLVEFIDYSVRTYHGRVKFLTFAEAAQRLNEHLLKGQPLRAQDGADNGVRLLDLNDDGYLDVVSAAAGRGLTRLWQPKTSRWLDSDFPTPLVVPDPLGGSREAGVRFGILGANGEPAAVLRSEDKSGAWSFVDNQWREAPELFAGLELDGQVISTRLQGRDTGVRLRDINRDGLTELLIANPTQNALFSWSLTRKRWEKQDYALPKELRLVDAAGNDSGLRFVDLNADGYDDLFVSNDQGFSVTLFVSQPLPHLDFNFGWTHRIRAGAATDSNAPPVVMRSQPPRNNGTWFAREHVWWQNEDTAHLPDRVDRRSYRELLAFDSPPPLSPDQAVESFDLVPGFTIELVAHEPVLKDPVAFEWGPDGKLWVVEMGDYPSGLDGKGKPGGIVRFLEDRDHDGRYERSTVFLDQLNFPTGVMPWRRGVIVSAAPEIFYAEDTDGDGRADVRELLLRGFKEGNQQHRVNGFEYGLDNWLYAANGESGGSIRVTGMVPPSSTRKAEPITSASIDLRGHDLRFQPDLGSLETIAGPTQFGRHRDDWGHWFGNNNPNWLWHYWIDERYVLRNPQLPVRTLKQPLANYPDSTRLFSRSPRLQRFNWPNMVNILTSANSPTPYRDTLFGPEFASSVFISEPANNLVHREVLRPDGPTFKSRRPALEGDREFLASRDNWFRPTMLKTGPDGALYVADMYRLVIEHLEYALPGMEQQIDVRAGEDQGRLYRVFPVGARLRPIPSLDRLSPAELVEALDSSNGWQRDTVQRLLVHSGDRSTVPLLQKLAVSGRHPPARLQALATLDGLNALTSSTLLSGLRDPEAGVRVYAIRLTERWRAVAKPAPDLLPSGLGSALLARGEDPDPRVRFQLALTLGEWPDPKAGAALLKLALREGGHDQWRIALLSSAPPHIDVLLDGLLHQAKQASPTLLEQVLALATAPGRATTIERALTGMGQASPNGYAPWQFSALTGFLDALRQRNLTLDQFAAEDGGRFRSPVRSLHALLATASGLATNRARTEQERLTAIRLLGRDPSSGSALSQLGSLLTPQESTAIQQAAVDSVGRSADAAAATLLIDHWTSFVPARRTQALQVLLSRRVWTESLLAAIESHRVPAGQITASIRQQLTDHAQDAISQRARQLFGTLSADRQKVVSAYEEVARLSGHVERGALLFRANCANCHRFQNEGIDLGPNLAALTDKSTPSLLVSILDPNRAVEPVYASYAAILSDERELTGIVLAETGNSVTLRVAGGAEETLLRSHLKQFSSNGLSLMPDGLEAAFDLQAMADLLAYLRQEPRTTP